MMAADEIRKIAWTRLWRDGWFLRLLGGTILLSVCVQAIVSVVQGVLTQIGVAHLHGYLVQLMERLRAGERITQSEFLSVATGWEFISASVLVLFFAFLMSGIAQYGYARIRLRCAANNAEGWLKDAFEGFKRPFELMWLFLRLWLIFLFWSLVSFVTLGIPILIAFYRYRFAYLVKGDHPDWTVGECLRSCRRMMAGRKWKSFMLDCSYWKPITLALLALLLAVGSMGSVVLLGKSMSVALILPLLGVGLVAYLVAFAALVVVGYYISVGQTLFYNEIKVSEEGGAA